MKRFLMGYPYKYIYIYVYIYIYGEKNIRYSGIIWNMYDVQTIYTYIYIYTYYAMWGPERWLSWLITSISLGIMMVIAIVIDGVINQLMFLFFKWDIQGKNNLWDKYVYIYIGKYTGIIWHMREIQTIYRTWDEP